MNTDGHAPRVATTAKKMAGYSVLVAALILLAGCGSSESPLDRASDDADDIVDISKTVVDVMDATPIFGEDEKQTHRVVRVVDGDVRRISGAE